MKRLLLLALIFSFPSEALASSERYENWFNDKYLYEKYLKDTDIMFCQFDKDGINKSKNKKPGTGYEECDGEKDANLIKLDVETSRKWWCDELIKTNFNALTKVKNAIDIKEDCKRIFNTYIYDPSFTGSGFNSSYVSFAIGEDLPFYKGKYKNGEKHGKGTYYYKSGSIFNGKYKEGKKDGKGTYVWSGGDRYIGDYKDDKKDGKGTYIWWHEDKYIGDWKDGKEDGKGTYVWSDGDKYIGDWKEGKRAGEGILYDKNKNIIKQGIWENSQLITSKVIDAKSLLSSKKSNQTSVNNGHEKCLKAVDYKGCMEYESGNSRNNKETTKIDRWRKFNDNRDCSSEICIGTGDKDLTDAPSIKGWFYLENPRDQMIFYYDPNAYKVNVAGEYGRYIHTQNISRYYSKPKAGSAGYSTTIGSGSTNCYDTGYGISCTTTPATRINIPGSAGSAGGVVNNNWDVIVDCDDQTVAFYKNNKLRRMKGSDGKKRKWTPIKYVLPIKATSRSFLKNEKEYCSNVNALEASSFTLLEKKGIKKNRRITGPDD